VLLVISIFFPAPLAAPIRDAAIPLGDIRAPWFFLWLQGLLRLGDAFWMGVGIPLVMAALMAALPYIFPALPAEQQGKWFPRAGRAAQVLAGTLILVWLVLTLLEGVR